MKLQKHNPENQNNPENPSSDKRNATKLTPMGHRDPALHKVYKIRSDNSTH